MERQRGNDDDAPDARATRAWITVTASEVAPASILDEVLSAVGLPRGETISFDGQTAATAYVGRSIARAHDPGTALELQARERTTLIAAIEALHAHDDILDVTFETHLLGDDDVRSEQRLRYHELIEHIGANRLVAGVRYLTD